MNVIKHNCRSPHLFFCDPEATDGGNNSPTCQPTKELREDCRFDAECASVRCVWVFSLVDRMLINLFFLVGRYKKGNCAPDVTTKNSKRINNVCSEPAGTTLRIAPWQWGATGFCIIGGK